MTLYVPLRINTVVPQNVRPVLIHEDLAKVLGARTIDGRLMSYDWGKPGEDGFWTPTVTIKDDGMTVINREELERLKDLAWKYEDLD